jgi:hypothetical protein
MDLCGELRARVTLPLILPLGDCAVVLCSPAVYFSGHNRNTATEQLRIVRLISKLTRS